MRQEEQRVGEFDFSEFLIEKVILAGAYCISWLCLFWSCQIHNRTFNCTLTVKGVLLCLCCPYCRRSRSSSSCRLIQYNARKGTHPRSSD